MVHRRRFEPSPPLAPVDWDERITRTYRLTPDTVVRLNDLAAHTRVWQSILLEALLAYALDELAAGRLQLEVRPMAYTLTGVVRVDGAG